MSEQTYTVEKSISERYHIRIPGSSAWAIITINDVGDFSVISDYGNYSYAWRSFGDNFKKFLIQICERCKEDPQGYLYSKIHDHAAANMVDVKKTIQEYKRTLLKEYREDRWRMSDEERQAVRECYDALNEIENEDDEVSQDFFFSTLMHDHRITEETLCWEYMIHNVYTTYDRQCEAFCREIAPVFAEILQKELEGEAVCA
jgi:hypothetical protein